MRGGGLAIIRNVAAQFKTAGDFLRMVAFNAGADRKIRRTAKDEVEFFVGAKHRGVSKIAVADFITIFESIVAGGFSGELDALVLRLDGYKARAGQPPRGNHSHRTNAAAQVQRGARGGTPGSAIPCGQNVIRGKTMAVAELKKAKMTADGVQRFVFPDLTASPGQLGQVLPSL